MPESHIDKVEPIALGIVGTWIALGDPHLPRQAWLAKAAEPAAESIFPDANDYHQRNDFKFAVAAKVQELWQAHNLKLRNGDSDAK